MIRAVQVRDARKRFREMAPVLNEQSLRRFVAMEARALGRGGDRWSRSSQTANREEGAPSMTPFVTGTLGQWLLGQ